MSASTALKTRYTIEEGPAAYVIFDHVKYAYDENVTIRVTFKIYLSRLIGKGFELGRIRASLHITGVEHENGSGQSLNISGYFGDDSFKGYYNARTRKGFIEVTS